MEHVTIILTVLTIHLLAVMSPGPDLLLIIQHSLRFSRFNAICASCGLGLGIFVHLLYCSLGLALVISQSIVLFSLFKVAAGLYLLFLGYTSFRKKKSGGSICLELSQVTESMKPMQSVKVGFLTNVLNPKVTIFFLSLFTIVITPTVPTAVVQFVGLMMIINTILWFSFVSVLFSSNIIKNVYQRFEKWFQRLFDTLMIALGLRVLSAK